MQVFRSRRSAAQSPLETYLREINETPLLTAAQEKELAQQRESKVICIDCYQQRFNQGEL